MPVTQTTQRGDVVHARSASRVVDAAVDDPGRHSDMQLPVAATIATMAGICGITGFAAKLLRGRGLSGAARGGGIMAGIGAAIAGATVLGDRATGDRLGHGLGFALDHRQSMKFLVTHPTRPWLGPLGNDTKDAARAAQRSRFDNGWSTDDAGDAFRHAFGSGLFALRLMRDRGESQAAAADLVREAGIANEQDRWDDASTVSHDMDLSNNASGVRITSDGRRADGSWLSDHELEQRVYDATSSGQLVMIDRSSQRLVPTVVAPSQ